VVRRCLERFGGRAALCLLGVAVVVGWILLTPRPAAAHAVLVSSSPASGATVGTTPDAVLLTFDEPLVVRLSGATVLDPSGQRFDATVSGESMRVPLRTNVPGVYRVSWTTVSEVDGHTITGEFRFGVGVAVPAAGTAGTPGPGAGDAAVAVVRTVEYVVLLLAFGLVVLRRLADDLPIRVPAVPVAGALLASGAAVVYAEARLATARLPFGAIADYLSMGTTGEARLAKIGLEVGLLVVAITARRLSVVLLVAIAGAIAVAGHAANADPAWQGMAVNALHLATAGVWAGGIMALAWLRVTGRWGDVGRPLLPRFSRVALWAFLASVVLGVVQAAQLLGGVGDLVHSGYGLTLMAKAAAIAVMVPLSLLAWRRRRAMVRAEAVLAVLVVAAAAALAAYPVIPKEAREAAEGGTAPGSAAAAQVSPFPKAGDLALAGRAGDTLVGLTVRPGRPGRNQVFAYLAPAPPAGADVRLAVDGASSAVSSCGPSCRSATVELRGASRLILNVGGSRGGDARFDLPALPAADGAALAQRATTWMAGLQSYRVDEVLSGIRSRYVYSRPHEMWVQIWLSGGVHETLWIDKSIYKRSSSTAAWSPPSPAQPAPVPYFVWRPFAPFVSPAIVGTATVDGVPVTLVSFFGGHGDDPEPVWFTLWIDTATDQVLRSQMWAPNHFMDDRYLDFNQPVDIPTPPGG
jgi:copper transport protein